MIQPNLSMTSDATSNPATQRPALMQSIQSAKAAFEYSLGADRDASRAARAAPDAAVELAYGCVDWFIYVTDNVAISPMTCLGGSE